MNKCVFNFFYFESRMFLSLFCGFNNIFALIIHFISLKHQTLKSLMLYPTLFLLLC